jgi:CubicO group peptidase (beta-lactamase class C family)
VPVQSDRVRAVYDAALSGAEQVLAYQESEQFFPCATVQASGHTRTLIASKSPTELDSLAVPELRDGQTSQSLARYLIENRVSGLLVLHKGKIVLEHYALGFGPEAKWMSMSMAKSVTSTLIGMAMHDGYIASLQDPLRRYLPELARGEYANVTIEQLLQMASGIRWNETYTDPASDRRTMLELQLASQAGSILHFMANLPRTATAGGAWNYSTGETHLAGALLAAALKGSAADYLSEKVWKPLGMQADANWWLDSPSGQVTGGSGLSATLRDYGRFGQWLVSGGTIQGRQVLPNNWLKKASQALQINGETIPYGYSWWTGHGMGAVHQDAYLAAGIFGQFLYIHPREQVVVVHLSAAPEPTPPKPFGLFGAIVTALTPAARCHA